MYYNSIIVEITTQLITSFFTSYNSPFISNWNFAISADTLRGMIRGPRTEEVRARVEIGSPCSPPSLGCLMAPWLANLE